MASAVSSTRAQSNAQSNARPSQPKGIPGFRPPPKIPKNIDTSEALDFVVEYDLVDSGI